LAKDSLDEWIYYLKNNTIPDNFTARGLAEAREKLRYDSLSEQDKKNYDHHLGQTRYEQNIIEDSFDQGKTEGKAEIALKMLEKGIALEDISDITGLNKQQIEQLIK
jgi:predicted transposase/invertase (TIGR01784 family)